MRISQIIILGQKLHSQDSAKNVVWSGFVHEKYFWNLWLKGIIPISENQLTLRLRGYKHLTPDGIIYGVGGVGLGIIDI